MDFIYLIIYVKVFLNLYNIVYNINKMIHLHVKNVKMIKYYL